MVAASSPPLSVFDSNQFVAAARASLLLLTRLESSADRSSIAWFAAVDICL
jgi:hypothetical protein